MYDEFCFHFVLFAQSLMDEEQLFVEKYCNKSYLNQMINVYSVADFFNIRSLYQVGAGIIACILESTPSTNTTWQLFNSVPTTSLIMIQTFLNEKYLDLYMNSEILKNDFADITVEYSVYEDGSKVDYWRKKTYACI